MSRLATADIRSTMAANDPDIDTLIRLIGQCLGRIDEQAFRLQDEDGSHAHDFDLPERLDDDTATLQELIESLLVVDADAGSETVVNDLVSSVLAACLDEFEVPIVIRRSLTERSSVVVAPRQLVAVSLQRALMLALTPLGPGDELRLTTRVEGGGLVVEIESLGSRSELIVPERAETLCDFVRGFGGTCEARCDDRNHLLLMLELPRAHVPGRRESDGFA